MSKTICIILNWNNASDTAKVALEVVQQHQAVVVVVDNNSTDNSLLYLSDQLQSEKVAFAMCKNEEVDFSDPLCNVYVLPFGQNYGFAGAINRVIRQILPDAFQYIWLLNNDALPAPNALYLLEQEMERDIQLGFVGSVIVDYKDRDLIQCCGVRYFPWSGVSKLVLKNKLLSGINPTLISNEKIDFQHGASLLVRFDMLASLGLMDERFFLYFEEQDWQRRAENLGYQNKLALRSQVFHKGSMSTEHSKFLFYYYYNTSAIIFSLKYNKGLVFVSSLLGIVAITLKRTRFNLKSLSWGIKGIINGFKTFNQ